MPELSGQSIIGFSRGTSDAGAFYAIDPSTAETLEPEYHSASSDELDRAARLAGKAFEIYGRVTGKEKAVFLRKIAVKDANPLKIWRMVDGEIRKDWTSD